MLCEKDDISDNYDGLDDDRDTEEEVETAIQFFPYVLYNNNPIDCLVSSSRKDYTFGCNLKAVSFIPVVARLSIELGLSFDRGGLLFEEDGAYSVLQRLICSDEIESRNFKIDDKYLSVMIRLREMDLLKKEDIKRRGLLMKLCGQIYHFAEKRFRFLVEWDPNAILYTDEDGRTPLHCNCAAWNGNSIRGFRLVFEAGIRFYPNKKGINLLFCMDTYNNTPFQKACKKHGYDDVMEVVEGTLNRYSDTPINTAEALVMAAIDENIHLDCVYFLLRREPDVIQKLLPSTHVVVAEVGTVDSFPDDGDVDGDDVDGDDDDNNNNRKSSKKRKCKATTATATATATSDESTSTSDVPMSVLLAKIDIVGKADDNADDDDVDIIKREHNKRKLEFFTEAAKSSASESESTSATRRCSPKKLPTSTSADMAKATYCAAPSAEFLLFQNQQQKQYRRTFKMDGLLSKKKST